MDPEEQARREQERRAQEARLTEGLVPAGRVPTLGDLGRAPPVVPAAPPPEPPPTYTMTPEEEAFLAEEAARTLMEEPGLPLTVLPSPVGPVGIDAGGPDDELASMVEARDAEMRALREEERLRALLEDNRLRLETAYADLPEVGAGVDPVPMVNPLDSLPYGLRALLGMDTSAEREAYGTAAGSPAASVGSAGRGDTIAADGWRPSRRARTTDEAVRAIMEVERTIGRSLTTDERASVMPLPGGR